MSMIRISVLFLIMMLSRKHASGPSMLILRCHAFASNTNTNTNKRQQYYSRSTGSMRLKHINVINNSWIIRRGGSATFAGNQQQQQPFQSTPTSRLSASPSIPLSVFENRAMESLAIAGGGETLSTSIKSFGGISYRDSSSSQKDDLYRVVFVLGGPGKKVAKVINYQLFHLKKKLFPYITSSISLLIK
ncbi:MAG: hypothetical protein ACI8RD_003594 [Bacillariaceae sp.]|jgi:hypothetical protein